MNYSSINRRNLLVSAASTFSACALATTPIPDPLSLNNYISIFGQLVFTGTIKKTVALPSWLERKLKDRGSDISAKDLKFEDANENSDYTFLEVEDVQLRVARSDKFTLAAIKSCKLERIYASTHHLRGSEEYKKYYENLIGKEVVLFLEPPTQYVGNAGIFLDRFYYISRGPNWRDGAPLPIGEYKKIHEIALQLGFIETEKLPCNLSEDKKS